MKTRAPDTSRHPAGALALLAACAIGLVACGTLGPRRETGTDRLVARLEGLRQLAVADEATQARLVSARQAEYDATHSPDATLGYALALAMPGHVGHDASAARRLLGEALAWPDGLDRGEQTLAAIQIAQLDAELKARQDQQGLQEEARRLRDDQAAARTATARRLLAEIEENVRLRRLLDEARAKLEAVADIAKGKK